MTPLLPGETVLWQGRPASGTRPDTSNPGKLLFGFALVAFALFWMDKAMERGPIWLAGLPFLAFGLKLSVWTAWAPRLRAKFAQYRLTDRRLLVDVIWPVIGARSQVLTLSPSTIIENDGQDPATFTLRHQVSGPKGNMTEVLTLSRIEDAARLSALIAQVQRSAA
ncbi:MAG TPA: hypothetical protein PLH11_08885 [Gemmobacter sp.]|nr:hypothetical protein [Gemmobacter sp.]